MREVPKRRAKKLEILEFGKLRKAELHPRMPNRPRSLQVAVIQRFGSQPLRHPLQSLSLTTNSEDCPKYMSSFHYEILLLKYAYNAKVHAVDFFASTSLLVPFSPTKIVERFVKRILNIIQRQAKILWMTTNLGFRGS